jgi:hypothetical protein
MYMSINIYLHYMDIREPISIKVKYTDSNGQIVERNFRSLYKASKTLEISTPTLKELYYGGHPKLKENVPKDITVTRIDTLPKPPKKHVDMDTKWHCDICHKDIKMSSKYVHVTTMSHKRNEANKKNTQ